MHIFLAAIAAVLLLVGALRWQAAQTEPSALFAFEPQAMAPLPDPVEAALGPLTAADIVTIERAARREVEGAFAEFGIRIASTGRAFWRVWVINTVTPPNLRGGPRRNAAGAAYAFGLLGGGAFVNFSTLASKAVYYAPDGSSRDEIVQAIGRGIGRSAVHELAHLVAGGAPVHSDDENSYEYETVDRPGQYYGALQWSVARPVLKRKLGPAQSAPNQARGESAGLTLAD